MSLLDRDTGDATTDHEETDEEYILRRTKYFNEETRRQKSNLQIWLDFIAFQDERQELEVYFEMRPS